MTTKPDKLPVVDPMQPDIYMAILRAVDIERKRRKTDEYRQAEKRREDAEVSKRITAEFERKQAEEEAYRKAQLLRAPGFIPFLGWPER